MSAPTTAPVALSPDEAAAYIAVSKKTLANWRSLGIGPAYVRHGSVGSSVSYLVADLDAYLQAHRVALGGDAA